MELTPKQQAVEQLRKAQKVLILGHGKPSGDMIGSGLALVKILSELGKKVEFVVSEPVPETYSYLPLSEIQEKFEYLEGKLIRIDTSKIPVKGLKYQKHENFLDIILDADKNLKFEFLEIKNSTEKPNLIVALDTPSFAKLDRVIKDMSEVFVGVPIINIDHHSGNDFFGAVNLVDLTATSTAEILVSLFEALGSKIADETVATALLTGIIEDTESFQKSNTTPKSFTVAAQLLAAGAKQQEIISHLFKKQPDYLMALWKKLTKNLKDDKKFALSWTSLSIPKLGAEISLSDVTEAMADLFEALKETNKLLTIVEKEVGSYNGFLMGENLEEGLLPLLKAERQGRYLKFKLDGENLENVEMNLLKKLADFWSRDGAPSGLWDVLAKEGESENLSRPETLEEIQETTESFSEPVTKLDAQVTGAIPFEKESREYISPDNEAGEKVRAKKEKNFDPIDNAIRSLAENQAETKGFTPLKDIMEKKKRALDGKLENLEDIDVFDEENE